MIIELYNTGINIIKVMCLLFLLLEEYSRKYSQKKFCYRVINTKLKDNCPNSM